MFWLLLREFGGKIPKTALFPSSCILPLKYFESHIPDVVIQQRAIFKENLALKEELRKLSKFKTQLEIKDVTTQMSKLEGFFKCSLWETTTKSKQGLRQHMYEGYNVKKCTNYNGEFQGVFSL